MKQGIAMCLAAGLLFAAFLMPTEARITRLQITTVESPTFGGRAFGASGEIGTYEKLVGRAYGEVDPNDPRNALTNDPPAFSGPVYPSFVSKLEQRRFLLPPDVQRYIDAAAASNVLR